MMSVRRLAVCLWCCVAGLAVTPVVAFGTGSSSEGRPSGEGIGASSLTEGSLVTPGSPTEGEQRQAQVEAKRSTPEAVAEREASRTRKASRVSLAATLLRSGMKGWPGSWNIV
jgi:hypothetical protein